MDMGDTLFTNFNNCDLAVEGSPIKSILISPLNFVLSIKIFQQPPKS